VTTHRLTVRARLTALYGGVFLLAGTVLLAITYVLLAEALNNGSFSREAVLAVPAGATTPAVTAETYPAETYPAAIDITTQAQTVERLQLAEELRVQFRRQTLTSLLQRGAVALAGVAVAGIWLGWLIAGRTLRPLQQITATARRVAGRNLHERIGLSGPRDELRQLADTFDDMLARLDESFGAQRRFVANASHELRTPLTINRTLIEVALSHPDPPPEVRRLGETLLAVNSRHERLLEGLLVLAGSDRELTSREPVDLAALSERLVEAAGPEAAAAGVGLRTALRPARVHGDPVLLERLVQNLLRNAISYNAAGGEVSVECTGTRLTVGNTGPVVLAHEVPGLFEPFRRLTDRVGSAEGSGLGLSIVRSIVTAHGGTVAAEPRPGGGLTVTVEFPPAQAAQT
jgi:signal transduction histidine kinase